MDAFMHQAWFVNKRNNNIPTGSVSNYCKFTGYFFVGLFAFLIHYIWCFETYQQKGTIHMSLYIGYIAVVWTTYNAKIKIWFFFSILQSLENQAIKMYLAILSFWHSEILQDK